MKDLKETTSSEFFYEKLNSVANFFQTIWASVSNFFSRLLFGKPNEDLSIISNSVHDNSLQHAKEDVEIELTSYDALYHQMIFEHSGFTLIDEGQLHTFDPLSTDSFASKENQLHYISVKRHKSPALQNLYDQNFGLVVVENNAEQVNSTDEVQLNLSNWGSVSHFLSWFLFGNPNSDSSILSNPVHVEHAAVKVIDEGQLPLSSDSFADKEKQLDYISANRHQSPALQNLYDQNFGLVIVQDNAEELNSTDEALFFQDSSNAFVLFSSEPLKFWSEFLPFLFLISLVGHVLALSEPTTFYPTLNLN